MVHNRKYLMILVLGLFMAGCQAAPTQTPIATSAADQVTAIVVTSTPNPAEAPTEIAIALPTATPEVVETSPLVMPDYSSSVYLDDRSTPAGLVLSYANAINRHEYIRAYSYWADEGPTVLGSLDSFSAGFDPVNSVGVSLGKVTSDGAAGSIYFTMPVLFTQSLSDGSSKRIAECAVMRFPQPANYGEPPITPLHFDQTSTSKTVDAATSDTDALASACSGDQAQGSEAVAPVFAGISDISSANYVDNRSGAIEVVSSLLNALNRKEYVRAYSYWQDTKAVGAYDAYAAGFSDTDTVTAVFGTVAGDAGAGQYNYQVPLAMIVKTTKNSTQTFVGCYTLHLSNPGMQGTLPFQPLGITKGHFKQYANGTDVNSLLASACN